MDQDSYWSSAMNWGGWNEFWAMGGYGFYVWGSYGVTLALIAAEIMLLRARRRSALHQTGNSAS
ncbi:MAG: heme exporter protein CcmD [Burkholderiales bacterium]